LAALAKSSVFFKTISKILDFFSVFTFYTFEFFYKLKKKIHNFFFIFLIGKEKALKYNNFLKNWLKNELSTAF
jgi:hypothetical protein